MGAEGRRNGAKCLLCVEKETHREVAKHEERRGRERESSSVARFMTAAAQRSRSAGGKEGGREGGREGRGHAQSKTR